MNDFIGGSMPLWAEWLTGLLAVIGSAFAAIGAMGLLRMPTFFRRIHTPTLGATLGVWSISLATAVYFSVQQRGFFLHALLIAFFVALTAPVTTIFLMRATLFRARQKELREQLRKIADMESASPPLEALEGSTDFVDQAPR